MPKGVARRSSIVLVLAIVIAALFALATTRDPAGASLPHRVPQPHAGSLEHAASPVRAAASQQAVTPDSTLRALSILEGRWVPAEDSLLARRPELRNVIVYEYAWLLGGKAMRMREGIAADGGEADLEGMVYWDPATEKIEFMAVAGKLDGQGRLFRGEFVVRADGRLERNYDVYYRTPADMPGEEYGGSRRRYREVIEPAGQDTLRHTLEWWLQGRWQPFARGRYVIKRLGT